MSIKEEKLAKVRARIIFHKGILDLSISYHSTIDNGSS